MCYLFRDIVCRKIGIIIKVGLNIFVDFRIEGGKINFIIRDDIVEVIDVLG